MLSLLKKSLLTFLIIMFGTVSSLFILTHYNQVDKKNIFLTSAAPLLSPAPTIIPQGSTETTAVVSPDGTAKLIMEKQLKEGMVSYTFLTSKADNHEQQIFSKIVSNFYNFMIPFNTWSPENKYVFIKESISVGSVYYVFNANGDLFSDNSPYINVTDLFDIKLADYTMTEITGWADPNLLIINTKTKQGEQGPSFWFEIPSRSFIQLSTHFG